MTLDPDPLHIPEDEPRVRGWFGCFLLTLAVTIAAVVALFVAVNVAAVGR